MPSTIAKVVGGFLAGALAVLIFHQGMYVLIQQLATAGVLGGPAPRGAAWSMASDAAAFGMPRVLNQAFWGGMWGILFAILFDRLPGPGWVRGFVFGMVFPMLLGSWLLVAALKGLPLFSGAMAKGGFNLMALRNGFLLNGLAYGIGIGLLYPAIATLLGARPRAPARFG